MEQRPRDRKANDREIDDREIVLLIDKVRAQDPQEVQRALSLLVAMAKKKQPRETIRGQLSEEEILSLLDAPEPKVRKNTARLAGELYKAENTKADDVKAEASSSGKIARWMRELLEAEPIQMVRPSYILAIGAMGQGELLGDYHTPEGTLEKFALEEAEALRKARSKAAKSSAGPTVSVETAHQLIELPRRKLILVTAQGRKALPSSTWQELQQDRTWLEVLVPIHGPEEIRPLLWETLSGEGPCRYRIEYRNQEDRKHGRGRQDRRPDRGRKIRELISRIGQEGLINDPSNYEVEVRVEESAQGERWYIRYYCCQDRRFDYRKTAIPASIHPANAAIVIELARPYLKEKEHEAAPQSAELPRVLDPCCGSGTLLIERAMQGPCRLTGVDIEKRAIQAARTNLKALKDQRDHSHLTWELFTEDLAAWMPKEGEFFDEIYANLPFGLRVGDHEVNETLYASLIQKLPRWLRPGGIAVLYTMEGRLLERELAHAEGLELLKRSRLYAGGLEPKVFILRRV